MVCIAQVYRQTRLRCAHLPAAQEQARSASDLAENASNFTFDAMTLHGSDIRGCRKDCANQTGPENFDDTIRD